MELLKSILSFLPSEDSTQSILNNIEIDSNCSLPKDYLNLLFPDKITQAECFKIVLEKYSKTTSSAAVIKYFTIIIKIIGDSQYSSQLLTLLENLQGPNICFTDARMKSAVIAISSYLARLPSIKDVMKRALTFESLPQNQYKAHYFSDLYRLINIISLLFPYLINYLNSVGRYYMQTSPYFIQFAKVIKDQICSSYKYLENIVGAFKSDFKSFSNQEMDCFVKSIPQIQLYCDSIEELVLSKYFRGPKINKKIYFRQQQIAQMTHFIQKYDSNNKKYQEEISNIYLYGVKQQC